MSQSEVYEFLANNKGQKFTSKQISDNIKDLELATVRRNLWKLVLNRFISMDKSDYPRQKKSVYWLSE